MAKVVAVVADVVFGAVPAAAAVWVPVTFVVTFALTGVFTRGLRAAALKSKELQEGARSLGPSTTAASLLVVPVVVTFRSCQVPRNERTSES